VLPARSGVADFDIRAVRIAGDRSGVELGDTGAISIPSEFTTPAIGAGP
jgi:hypothetical protein